MEVLLKFFTSHTGWLVYVLLFAILFLSGLGLPVPEDAVLLSGGFLIYFGYTEYLPTVVVMFAGVLGGDILIFTIGWKWGGDVVRHKSVKHLLTPKRLARVQRHFEKSGTMTILLARFLMGLRAATYLLAGSMRMPFRQFFWLDFLAALVSVPLVSYLGFVFAPQLESLLHLLRRIEVLILIAALLVAGFFYWHRRSRKSAAV